MALEFKLVKRTHPQDKTKSFYVAHTKPLKSVDIAYIAERIAKATTYTAPECKAVLEILADIASDELQRGFIIDLGELGRIRPSVRSKSVEKPEEFDRTKMKLPGIIFTPGRKLQAARKEMKYSGFSNPIGKEKPGPVNPGPGTGGGGEPTPGGGGE